MSRIIAYDMCRMFVGPYSATPRGIDRIDLAMANHVFADPDSPHIAILPTPLGVRAYPAHVARRLLDHLQTIWGESAKTQRDPRLQGLITGMQARTPASGTLDVARLRRAKGVLRMIATVRHTGLGLGRAAEAAVPTGAVYVNLGQLALAMPMFFTWLGKRPDVACALMLHDTIPLDHPEMVKPVSVGYHATMIGTAAAHADCLIFSTAFAQASVNAALARMGRDPLPGLVRSLPVPAAFAKGGEAIPQLAGIQYFVVVSTIEPRKNFGLLLRVWQRLVETRGGQAPHLVIVGAHGLDAERILAPLAGSAQLRERVHHVSGLTTPALARLVAGCAAVLSPSFAEGFGLPLLEGIAMGVPTIASDIPSHREIAHATTTLLATDDAAGWEAAIVATPRPAAGRRRVPLPFALSEAAYCADLMTFIETVEGRRWPRAVRAGSEERSSQSANRKA